MENTMTVQTTTEVPVSEPVKPTIPDVSLDPMDFQKELAKIAAETGQKLENGNAVPLDAPPDLQAQAPAPQSPAAEQAQALGEVKVPPKFQTPDGQVDVTKVEKSTLHAEAALKRYQALEAELRQKQNEVAQLKAQPAQPWVQTQAPWQSAAVNTPPANAPAQNPAAAQALTPDAINRALEATKNPGQVLLELQAMTYAAALENARREYDARFNELRERQEAEARKVELQKIAERDPWVFSEEGIKELASVRQNKPWLNASPEPWLEAYRSYVAERELNRAGASQAVNPNPTSVAAKAPATPANGTGRTVLPAGPSIQALSNDREALNAFLDKMTPEQQRAFWTAAIPGAK